MRHRACATQPGSEHGKDQHQRQLYQPTNGGAARGDPFGHDCDTNDINQHVNKEGIFGRTTPTKESPDATPRVGGLTQLRKSDAGSSAIEVRCQSGGSSSELCIGTRKSSEEERQAVIRESFMGNGEDRGKTSVEVRGGAEGVPLGHAPGHGIEQQRGLTEMLLRSKCGAKWGVVLRPEYRDTRSSEAAQPRIS